MCWSTEGAGLVLTAHVTPLKLCNCVFIVWLWTNRPRTERACNSLNLSGSQIQQHTLYRRKPRVSGVSASKREAGSKGEQERRFFILTGQTAADSGLMNERSFQIWRSNNCQRIFSWNVPARKHTLFSPTSSTQTNLSFLAAHATALRCWDENRSLLRGTGTVSVVSVSVWRRNTSKSARARRATHAFQGQSC